MDDTIEKLELDMSERTALCYDAIGKVDDLIELTESKIGLLRELQRSLYIRALAGVGKKTEGETLSFGPTGIGQRCGIQINYESEEFSNKVFIPHETLDYRYLTDNLIEYLGHELRRTRDFRLHRIKSGSLKKVSNPTPVERAWINTLYGEAS